MERQRRLPSCTSINGRSEYRANVSTRPTEVFVLPLKLDRTQGSDEQRYMSDSGVGLLWSVNPPTNGGE